MDPMSDVVFKSIFKRDKEHYLIKIFHINLLYFVKMGYNDYKKLSLFDRMCMIFLTKDRATLEKIVKGDVGLMNIKKAIEDLNNDILHGKSIQNQNLL